jgi:hypothetical protein
MSDSGCPHQQGCQIYPLFTVDSALETWKIIYCRGDFVRCRRYRLANEGKPIPPNLLPNGVLLRKPPAGGGEGQR